MGILEGRVAVITGAGRGIGREHALLFAREGAKVVVNDLGCDMNGNGRDPQVAAGVVKAITSAGGTAVANTANVSEFADAGKLIEHAVDTFGGLDIVVNNAGIIRDRFFAQMTEAEWDAVIGTHLKGHFSVLRQAVEYWKDRYFADEHVDASVINTASASGLLIPNPGQANYGVAKAAVATLTLVAATELERFGIRVNAIAPIARTRLTENTPGPVSRMVAKPADEKDFDRFHPREVSPLAAYLAAENTAVTGQVFTVHGGIIEQCGGWRTQAQYTTNDPWTIGGVEASLR